MADILKVILLWQVFGRTSENQISVLWGRSLPAAAFNCVG